MERIKNAIENVRAKEQHGTTEQLANSLSDTRKHIESTRNEKRISIIKRVAAIVLIFTAGGAWFRLDCMNEQEKGASEHIGESIQQTRAEAKRRVLSEARFGFLLRSNLTNCNEAADKARRAYVNLLQEATPRKKDKFNTAEPIVIDPEPVLMAAKTECQKTYDAQLKTGQF